MLDHVRIVLSQPSHPGNIGAVARAMKTMGLTQLVLVNPKCFPHPEALARASGADDVLAKASVVSNLEQALYDSHLVLGLSSRARALSLPVMSARECAQKIAAWLPQKNIALLFGNERSGLSNEELARCQYHVTIPTHSEYSSLNLAFSVQILAYEIFQAVRGESLQNGALKEAPYAKSQDYALLFERLERMLVTIGYLDPKAPKYLMPRLKRLLHRGNLRQDELNILLGICKAVLTKASTPKDFFMGNETNT